MDDPDHYRRAGLFELPDSDKREEVANLVTLACRQYGKLDVLINNAGTKNAVRAISEGLRQEAGDKLRVTVISPGFVNTDFADSMTNPEVKSQVLAQRDKMAIPTVFFRVLFLIQYLRFYVSNSHPQGYSGRCPLHRPTARCQLENCLCNDSPPGIS